MDSEKPNLGSFYSILMNARTYIKNHKDLDITIFQAMQHNTFNSVYQKSLVNCWLYDMLHPYGTIEAYVKKTSGITLNSRQVRKYRVKWLKILAKQCNEWYKLDHQTSTRMRRKYV